MPSKPLFGMPVVVGMSDAVMAMRNTFSCAKAGDSDSDSSEAASREARARRLFFMHELRSVGPHARSGPGFLRLGDQPLKPRQIVPRMRLIVDAGCPQMDVRDHRPQRLAQGAGGFHGVEGSA